MQKLWKILLPPFVLLANSSCSNIPIKDVTLYWPVGPDGAVVTHTLSDTTAKLTKPEWDAISNTTVAMLYEDFGWIRATIEKLCSEHKGMCKPEVVKEFGSRTRLAAIRAKRKEQ